MIIKNIETKVRLATFIAGGSFLTSIVIALLVSFFAFKQIENARRHIYVMDASYVPLVARQTDLRMNRPVEYKAHVHLFHTLFFSLTPDDEFIEQQMRRAMYLIDESGALQYNNLKEKGYFNSILSSNAVLTLQTDSIVVDPVRKYFRYYGKQKIDRRSSTIVRSLVTEGYLKDLPMRSENNPHAVLITHWKTLENNDLSHVPKNTF